MGGIAAPAYDIYHKKHSISILSSTQLHLLTSYANNFSIFYNLFITDKTISVYRRGYDFYYKWIFSYQLESKSDSLVLKNIEIEENNSKFLLSSRYKKDGCNIEYGEEYSYKELKEKCDDTSEIKAVIKEIKAATLSCKEAEDFGVKYFIYYLNINNKNNEMTEWITVDQMNYILDNMKVGSYSIKSKDFNLYYKHEYLQLLKRFKDNRMIDILYNVDIYEIIIENVKVTNKENYTLVEYESGNSNGDIFICLESECKYICEIDNYESEWYMLQDPCYELTSDFDSDFNDVYKKIFNQAKNYNSNQTNKIKSLVNEEKSDIKDIKTAAKGYYYEDVKEGSYGYYKGYFIVNNIITLIEQTSSSEQYGVKQLKLVLSLDSETNIDDEIVDKEKSGVEPKYDDDEDHDRDDESCKYFIPLKDKDTKYSICNVNLDLLVEDYINKEYNLTINGNETQLIIHDTNYVDGRKDVIITLTEYKDSIKLNEIINRITKFTKPIPENKCLYYNTSEEEKNEISSTAVYNQIFYTNEYRYYSQLNEKYFEFTCMLGEENYYQTRDWNFNYFSTVVGYENQYIYGIVAYHKFVDFKENEFIECNENVKNDVLKELEDRINKIKKEEGISDKSTDDGDNKDDDDDESNIGFEIIFNSILLLLLLVIFI